jgi:hypothetical protein
MVNEYINMDEVVAMLKDRVRSEPLQLQGRRIAASPSSRDSSGVGWRLTEQLLQN